MVVRIKSQYQKYRFVSTLGGWNIVDVNGKSVGKISRCKKNDFRILVLKGSVSQIKDVLESRVLKNI
jgi:hypothetical protein